jgi:hypothetical protein
MGRWQSSSGAGRDRAWVTQAGLTPVIRYDARPEGAAWFAEAGVGANLIAPVFHENERRFSSTFNFGDHVGVGRYLDAERRHELALLVQHFSNAGIKHPNPGVNFLQLRYSFKP